MHTNPRRTFVQKRTAIDSFTGPISAALSVQQTKADVVSSTPLIWVDQCREMFRKKRSPYLRAPVLFLYFTNATIFLNTSGSFSARSASTLRSRFTFFFFNA